MNAREKRIRILDLQDQHCCECEQRMKPLKNCVQHCEVGKELAQLGEGLIRNHQTRRMNTCEHWDDVCKQAVTLHAKGIGYTIIAKKLNCHPSSLRDQLKKRGVWCGESQEEILEKSRQKWNRLCKQAVMLREKGLGYPQIARQLEVAVVSLRDQMQRRGLM
ncbi:hypothetical protein BW897_15335 [Bacillus cereus]|uniref:Zinc-finger domain-containing protein n=1 Tax=Bacillus cereus TaxID=1396 RepID=A0A1S9TQ35_BACCE|nr:hypothetical protein [Bacillus cereus]OOR12037.1 hypothetical protein BW897_15335 [Bacillus cereus]